ncbi:hypothetical protein NP493_113g04159 [Ridgeia piscesae]|uniref:Uncharacterized protein n=1 Tax=Ridgeia piscesae TaxID=27915 RepID=A0AAD9UH79_RIDPI|nr:hypothetical protein NP493_113g04159 [Ridgeia piscesae]
MGRAPLLERVTLGLSAISSLATRYGGKDMTMFFEDFALCLARTVSLRVAADNAVSMRESKNTIQFTAFLSTLLPLTGDDCFTRPPVQERC